MTLARKILLALAAVVSLAVACRGQLPPTEPPRGGEKPPVGRTDDGVLAAPVVGEQGIAPSGSLGGSAAALAPLPGAAGGIH